MKIRECLAILLVASLFLPSTLLADNSGWYVSGDVGQSRFTGTGDLNSPFFPISFTATDTAYKATIGYQFNTYLGLEASYVNFGKVTGNGSYVDSVAACGLPCENSYAINSELKSHGWSLELTGTYPLNDQWSVFARAGAIDARSELDSNYTPIPPWAGIEQPFSTNKSGTNWEGTFGFGVGVNFTDNWALHLSWDRYVNLGSSDNTGSYCVNLAALGIMYRF